MAGAYRDEWGAGVLTEGCSRKRGVCRSTYTQTNEGQTTDMGRHLRVFMNDSGRVFASSM